MGPVLGASLAGSLALVALGIWAVWRCHPSTVGASGVQASCLTRSARRQRGGAKRLASDCSTGRSESPVLDIQTHRLPLPPTLPDYCAAPEPPTMAQTRFDPPSRSLRSSASSDLRQPSREVMPVGAMWSSELPPLALSPRTAHPPRFSAASMSTDEDEVPYVPPQPAPARPVRVRSMSPGHSRRTSGFIGDDDRSAFTPSPTLMLGGNVSPVPSRRVPS